MFQLTRTVVQWWKLTLSRPYPSLWQRVKAYSGAGGVVLLFPVVVIADVSRTFRRILPQASRHLVFRTARWTRQTALPFLRTPAGAKFTIQVALAVVLLTVAAILISLRVSSIVSFILVLILYFLAMRPIRRRFKLADEQRRIIEEGKRQAAAATEASRRRMQEDAERQRRFEIECARQTRWLDAFQKEFDSHHKARLCTSCQKICPDYLLPRCPFCEASTESVPVLTVNGWSQDDLNEYVGKLCSDMPTIQTPPLPIIPDTIVAPAFGTDSLPPASLQSDFDERISNRDFIGIGNRALSVLLDRMLLDQPDGVATLLASLMPIAVAEKFDIPSSLTYACPHRDNYLPAIERGHWKTDTYPQIIISAYVLGATWQNLPTPHHTLLPYYRAMAERQTEIIETLRDQLNTRAKEVYTTDDIEGAFMDLTLMKPGQRALTLAQGSQQQYEFGQIVSEQKPEQFFLSDFDFSVHSCVLGQTGSGKSKFLELLMRYLTVSRKGFALIDPHGDLSEDLLAYAAYRKVTKQDKDILSRIHYIEPSYEQVFHFDPFRFRPRKPISPDSMEKAVDAWLHTKADRLSQVFLRKQGQSSFMGMPRLQRMLRNVLVAVGTSVNGNGQHTPLADALVLLDINHVRHHDVFKRLQSRLDKDVLSDFDVLHSFKNIKDVRLETESTVNWMRSFLSPIVKSIFADHVHTIDFPSIIENGEILLVNLHETDYFSADQGLAIGGLIIQEILSAAQNAPRDLRAPFHLIVDEASEYIGEDIQRALGVMRKFRLSICLAAQDLSSFKKEELDLRPKVLSQCGTIVSFRQSWPDDLDILSRVMCTGNLDFTKHYQIVDRPDGYKIMEIDEFGEQFTWGTSTTEGFATSESSSTSRQESESTSRNDSWSDTDTRSENHTDSTSSSKSESRTKSTHDLNVQQTVGRQSGSGSSDMSGTSHGSTIGGSSGRSSGTSVGESSGTSTSKNTSTAKNESQGKSISHRKVPLAQHREESHETPQLLNNVADQLERFKSGFHRLTERQAIVKLRSRQTAVVIETTEVVEKWSGPDKFKAIERMKQRVFESHAYCGAPNLGNGQHHPLPNGSNGHADKTAENGSYFA